MRLLLAAVATIVSTLAFAAQAPGLFILGGSGSASCGHFLAALQDSAHIGQAQAITVSGTHYVDDKYLMMEYADGFLTGLNIAQTAPSQQISVDSEALEVWLTNYCKVHPTDIFLNAVAAFARQSKR